LERPVPAELAFSEQVQVLVLVLALDSALVLLFSTGHHLTQ
jgi:hypothetical protein